MGRSGEGPGEAPGPLPQKDEEDGPRGGPQEVPGHVAGRVGPQLAQGQRPGVPDEVPKLLRLPQAQGRQEGSHGQAEAVPPEEERSRRSRREGQGHGDDEVEERSVVHGTWKSNRRAGLLARESRARPGRGRAQGCPLKRQKDAARTEASPMRVRRSADTTGLGVSSTSFCVLPKLMSIPRTCPSRASTTRRGMRQTTVR